MLDIPTARTNVQARRTARQPAAPDATGFGLATQPASSTPTGGPGMTSLTPTAPTASQQTTPYQYASSPWNDPVAQSTMKSWYEDPAHGFADENQWNPGGGTGYFERSLANAKTYDEVPGVYHSEISPERFNPEQKEAYIAGGGTYYNQFSPAQNAGVPYYAATGEAAPVMNMQTGVAENPLTGAAMNTAGMGSFHTLQPDVINKMWR